MKYCSKCGEQVSDDASFCSKCGANVNSNNNETIKVDPQQTSSANYNNSGNMAQESTLTTVAKAFMIVGCVVMGLAYLIPLAWCIPMTVVYFNKVKNNEQIGTGFKVCCLLFVSLVAGICMLCDNQNNQN
ncbi:MAG: zinc-ribbon domain-containing protein [Clostridia bacterium]|nr:zinc-ribbon domain-containing protein [Clostridia bacterium]